MRARTTVRSAVWSALLFCMACGGTIDPATHDAAVRAFLTTTPAWVEQTPLGRRLWTIEQTFYAQRGYHPAWIDGDRESPELTDLISQLRYSKVHGLDPSRYGVQAIEARLRPAYTKVTAGYGGLAARVQSHTRMQGTRLDEALIPALDARATYAYLTYAADLLGWTHSARQVYANWLLPPRKADLVEILNEAAGHHVRESLEALAPTHPQYKGLQVALAQEERHPTGHALQLKMNLERWRWAPRDLGDRYILVNVPAYQLQVMEGDAKPVLSMRVIVGDPKHPTPLFDDLMTYVVFSPYWNIPESIIRTETIHRITQDPDYLARNRIEVLRTGGKGELVDPSTIDWASPSALEGLRFRQAPGDENSLGLVKFIFPNHFNVYLHDTSARALFARTNRALSHGCVRVEQPEALARYVLQGRPAWTEDRIRAAMHAKDAETVTLDHPLPVHIGYWTAWVEPDGKTVTYTADPYEIDKAQAAHLTQASARQRS